MEYLAVILVFVISFLAGYFSREIHERLKVVELYVKVRVAQAKKETEDHPSLLLDPDDVSSKVRAEHEKRLKELNP